MTIDSCYPGTFILYILQAWHTLSLTMMVASIAVVILETVSSLRVHYKDAHHLHGFTAHHNINDNNDSQHEENHDHDHQVLPDQETLDPLSEWTDTIPNIPLLVIEVITFGFLLIEFSLRFVCSFNKRRFLTRILNICDMIVLVSQAAMLIYILYQSYNFSIEPATKSTILLFQIPRIVRIARIYSVAKNFVEVHIIIRAIRHSSNEFILLFVLLASASVFYASILFYVEIHINNLKSIPIGIWWAVVTMTTVGYGDYAPNSFGGFIVGSLCAVSGIVIVALPTPVIVSNFSRVYDTAKLCEIIARRDVQGGSQSTIIEIPEEKEVTRERSDIDELMEDMDRVCNLPNEKRKSTNSRKESNTSSMFSSKVEPLEPLSVVTIDH